MKNTALILVAAAILLAPTAHATSIDCGDTSLGTRTLTVSPALACRDAGLINLGDSGLEALSFVDEVLERDTANSNGGLLDITGVGGFSGGWTIGASVWDDWEDVFLYFKFGNGPPGTDYNPDWFIVEIGTDVLTGTWSIQPDDRGALSNVALLAAGERFDVPEPGAIALLGLGLVGFTLARSTRAGQCRARAPEGPQA